MSNMVLGVKEIFFFPGSHAKFEGHFIMSSNDPELILMTNEIKQATSSIPNYQLLLKVKDRESYEMTDCLIHRFEEDGPEYTKCYFYCNDIERIE